METVGLVVGVESLPGQGVLRESGAFKRVAKVKRVRSVVAGPYVNSEAEAEGHVYESLQIVEHETSDDDDYPVVRYVGHREGGHHSSVYPDLDVEPYRVEDPDGVGEICAVPNNHDSGAQLAD